MIRRGFLLAGTAALMTLLMLLCAAAAEAQPTAEDLLDRMPAETAQDMAAASEDLIGLGPEAIRAVCGLLVPAGEGDDVNARYLLSGLARHVSPGGAEEARLMVSGAFLEALEAAENPEVKAFLIRQVQVCGGDEAIGALRPYLDDDYLVEPATQALLAIRGESAAEALESAFEGAEGSRAVTLIKALGDLRVASAADQIVPFAASEDRDTRLVVYQALAEMGVPQALEPLSQAYETAGPYEKAKVISYGLTYTRRLAEAGDTETANAILYTLMTDEQASVRSAALSTLVDIGSPRAQALLLAAMADPSLEYRSAALNLAGTFPSVEATRQWIARMDDVSPEVRAEIIAMLGTRGDNTAAEVLTRQILAEDKAVRMAAIQAATKLTGRRAVAPMLERLRSGAEEDEIEAIKTWLLQVPGRQLVKACANALEQTPTEARIALLEVLKQRHAQTERRAVFAQARADDARVRMAALDALTTAATPEDISQVIELVVEASSDTEKDAARAVLILLARENPRGLFNAIEDHSGQARADLLAVLAPLGTEAALERAVAGATSENPAVQDAGVRALAEWPDPVAMSHLLEIANATDNDTHYALALRAFLRLLGGVDIAPGEKVAQYAAALETARRAEEKTIALDGLATIRTIESLEVVAQRLDDETVNAEAARAAVQIACPQDEDDSGLAGPEAAGILRRARGATDNEELHEQIDAHLGEIDPEAEEGFVALFNGEDLTGWEGDTEGYAAEDGMLVCKPGGNLYTVDDYANFILRLEFKLTPAANNGIALRVPFPAHAAYDGMEIQILDDTAEKYKDLKPYQFHGSIYGVVPARTGFLRPVGEWNEQEVIADGSQITITLNGEVIVDACLVEASKDGTIDGRDHPGLLRESGRLGFCGHGDVVYFRNIRVKELS